MRETPHRAAKSLVPDAPSLAAFSPALSYPCHPRHPRSDPLPGNGCGLRPSPARPVLRASAWSAACASLKAEVRRAEPREGCPTRNRAKKDRDFADEGDTAQSGPSRWLGHHPPCRHSPRSFLSVPSAPSAVKRARASWSGQIGFRLGWSSLKELVQVKRTSLVLSV
jgi:hypothetical protein